MPVPFVLVVDDEHLIADTLVAILRSAGYAAAAAYDGESALEQSNLVPPDLVLSDVGLPGMNGVEATISIQKAVPDCRALLFSAHAASVELAMARSEGYEFTILTKPIHPQELLQEVSSKLELRKTTKRDIG